MAEPNKTAGLSENAYLPVRAPRGATLTCQGWQQEAALRLLMNSLDPEVAEQPRDLVVCGSTVKAARDWASYHAIAGALKALEHDQTLLIQSGKPTGVFRTHEAAPRVLIANSNRIGRWANGEDFRRLERPGLVLYGLMSAASWTYVGTQTVLQDTYEIFAAAAQKHFGGNLAGRLVVSGGMGGMGGAQPLAATLNGAAFLGIEVDAERIKHRIRSGYCDICVYSLNEAVRILKNAVRQKRPVSVGLVGNCADVIPKLARRGIVPDLLTDQTGAHDPLEGYVPSGLSPEAAAELRRHNPEDYLTRAQESIARHVAAMLELEKLGAVAFDFGNNIRTVAFEQGVKSAYSLPGFFPTYFPPLFQEGREPLSWVALSGEPADIYRSDDLLLKLFPDDELLNRWMRLARKYVRFEGLPARVTWLRNADRAAFGEHANRLVARGELKAPLVIARHGLDFGPAASPFPEPEAMKGRSDAIADWPPLNALLNTASGATWAWFEHAGGASGDSLLAGVAAVADGTPDMEKRLNRVLSNDVAQGDGAATKRVL